MMRQRANSVQTMAGITELRLASLIHLTLSDHKGL